MKTCVIAGATGGIGRALVDEVARRGWNVIACGRNKGKLAELSGCKTEVCTAYDDEHCGALFDGLAGEISAVYAAGFANFGDSLEYSSGDWDETIEVNLTGMFHFDRAAIAAMKGVGSGRIVNVLSIASKHAFPSSAAYVASKHGGLGLTRSLAAEYRTNGVLLTAFMPGSTDTDLWETQDWKPEATDMLKPAEVASAIADILDAPASVSYDEVVLLPPKGIL